MGTMHNTNLAYRLTEAALNPLELLPLARGAKWRYGYSYSYYWVNSTSGTVRINRYGTFELSVIRENSRWEGRSFTVRTRLDIGNRLNSQDTFGTGRQSDNIRRIRSYMDRKISLIRNALWYDNGSEVEYMMPAAYTNGGFIDMRIFNFPGVAGYPGRFDFFSTILGPGRFSAGKYIYRATIPGTGIDRRAATFSTSNEGLLSLESRTRHHAEDLSLIHI